MHRFLLALAALLASDIALGAEPGALSGSLTLRHVASDVWQAEYRFDQPITAVDFGPPIVEFRRSAWTVRTPDAALVSEAGNELVRGEGKPFQSLQLEVHQYDAWTHDAYVPMDRHSDGGTAIYLGHFMGRALQDGVARDLALRIRLEGLGDETAFLPAEANEGHGVYAYFGPQQIVESGSLRALIDPATPAWIRDALADTGSRVAAVYEARLGRPAPATLALIVGAGGLDAPGYSIKGGALPGQLVYKLEGSDLRQDSPEGRRRMQQLAAHELAHVWQANVARGGIGQTQPWVHEGGAEALSLAALQASGLWTADEVAEQGARLVDECRAAEAARAADASLAPTWRDNYTCGYARFDAFALGPFQLWQRLIAQTEASGEPYSEAMIDGVLAAGEGGAVPSTQRTP